jgi:class 3 adenylate cyclase
LTTGSRFVSGRLWEWGLRVSLPTGTVTFLLTDIEGSTALWEGHGEAMGAAVARHEEIITSTVQDDGGVLVKAKGEGDSTFSVFPRATDAAAAAIDAQTRLIAEPRAAPAVSVRMAVHTGEAEVRDGDYFGAAVNRAAGCARWPTAVKRSCRIRRLLWSTNDFRLARRRSTWGRTGSGTWPERSGYTNCVTARSQLLFRRCGP